MGRREEEPDVQEEVGNLVGGDKFTVLDVAQATIDEIHRFLDEGEVERLGHDSTLEAPFRRKCHVNENRPPGWSRRRPVAR